jgi:hypothetical protein
LSGVCTAVQHGGVCMSSTYFPSTLPTMAPSWSPSASELSRDGQWIVAPTLRPSILNGSGEVSQNVDSHLRKGDFESLSLTGLPFVWMAVGMC